MDMTDDIIDNTTNNTNNTTIDDIPIEIIALILDYIPANIFTSLVCKKWDEISNKSRILSVAYIKNRVNIPSFKIKLAYLLASRTTNLYNILAESGDIPMISCLHKFGYRWGKEIYTTAAINNHIDLLDYLLYNYQNIKMKTFEIVLFGSFDGYFTKNIARKGLIDCLKWLDSNKHRWPIEIEVFSKNTCIGAAAGGHLELLKWLHENGALLDKHTLMCAVECGRADVVKYIVNCDSNVGRYTDNVITEFRAKHNI